MIHTVHYAAYISDAVCHRDVEFSKQKQRFDKHRHLVLQLPYHRVTFSCRDRCF